MVEYSQLVEVDEGIDAESLRAVVYNVAFQRGNGGAKEERRKLLVLWCRVHNIFFLGNWKDWDILNDCTLSPEDLATIDAAWKDSTGLKDIVSTSKMNKACRVPPPQIKAHRDKKNKEEKELKRKRDKEEKTRQEQQQKADAEQRRKEEETRKERERADAIELMAAEELRVANEIAERSVQQRWAEREESQRKDRDQQARGDAAMTTSRGGDRGRGGQRPQRDEQQQREQCQQREQRLRADGQEKENQDMRCLLQEIQRERAELRKERDDMKKQKHGLQQQQQQQQQQQRLQQQHLLPETQLQLAPQLEENEAAYNRWERWASGQQPRRQPQFERSSAEYAAHVAEMNTLQQMQAETVMPRGVQNDVRVMRDQIVQARTRMLGESNPAMFEHLQSLVVRLQSQVAAYEARYY